MGREVTANTQKRRLTGLEVYADIGKLPFNVSDKVVDEAIRIILAMLDFTIKTAKNTDKN